MINLSDNSKFSIYKINKFLPVLFLISLSCLISWSCGSNKENTKEESAEEGHEHHEEGGSTVEINAGQYKQLNIQLGSVEKKNLSASLKSTGYLKVPPQNKASITSFYGGTVHQILAQEGDFVNKGQVLLTLSNPLFVTMQQEFLDAVAQLTFAEADYNRQKTLAEKNVTAQKTFQQSTSNYTSLKNKRQALGQQLTLLGIDIGKLSSENITSDIYIKSPVNGYVAHIDINLGSNAEPSKPLLEVIDNSQLHLDAFVFEQDLPKVKAGQMIDVMLTNLPGQHYDAKIFSIGSAFEGESKSIPIHAAIIGDKKGLIEGMSVIANINIGDNAVPSVPTSAIASFGGNDYIFIQTESDHHSHEADEKEHQHKEGEKHEEEKEHVHKEGEKHNEEAEQKSAHEEKFSFKRVQVKKGISENGFTEILPLEVIPANSKIVINGAFYLMAMLTNAGEEGHAH